MDVIFAADSQYGIGYKGCLPWNCPEELGIFKSKTFGGIVIVGGKTAENMPDLPGRIIYVVSKTIPDKKIWTKFSTLEDAIRVAMVNSDKVFIAGGGQIYRSVFENFGHLIKDIHMSVMNNSYECDTFFDKKLIDGYVVKSVIYAEEFKHFVLSNIPHVDHSYSAVVRHILRDGSLRHGRNGETISTFVENMTIDLRDGFPILSTKKVFFRGVVEECLFFINGRTNSKILEMNGVKIWKGNTSRENLDSLGFLNREEGEMGPMYGSQWRNFMAPCDENTGRLTGKGIDQLERVIEEIRGNPSSRRILMTDYNPAQVHLGVLPPCHSIILHFYVDDDHLDVFCYNRSSDIGLGLPFNITSTALLLSIIAKITNLTPRFLKLTLGDAHIYSHHTEALKEQICRRSYAMPSLILPEITNLCDLEYLASEDFRLDGYVSHPAIKMNMVV